MGRNAGKDVQNQGKTLMGTEGTNATQNQGNAQAAESFLMPAYKGMYANPGYSGPDKSAIIQATEGGTGAAFGAATQEATNRAARTGNAAGLTSSMDEMARERMRVGAAQGAANETRFADAARSDREKALGGIQGLYGTATGAGVGYTGQENQTLGTLSANASRMKQGGFWNNFMDSLGKSAGSLGFSKGGYSVGGGEG